MARPFLKWAGGKRQLISEIEARLPADIDECTTYVEPFIGGGSVLFHLLETRKFERVIISDANPELTLCYSMIKLDAKLVGECLQKICQQYPEDKEGQAKIFFNIRDSWNQNVGSDLSTDREKATRVARTLFLNKTCFNGLFRVNSRGLFNVPPNYSKKPSFPSLDDLKDVQRALRDVEIKTCTYENSEEWIDSFSFVYLDPPYRPLPETSSFVAYTKSSFNDENQIELASFCDRINSNGARFLLSNSDPTNSDLEDSFFDDLYSKYRIDRIEASRAINSKGDSRGKIREIMVFNY